MALKARMSWWASATVWPFTAALIIEAELWLIEQPWPAIFRSWTTPSATSR